MKSKIYRPIGSEIETLSLENNKMAFISGPRQVGKTFLSKQIAAHFHKDYSYFNWDSFPFRKQWQSDPDSLVNKNMSCIIFDEIHKAHYWKSTLKGIYDIHGEKTKIIVTGSARLDTLRKSGDSLLGRYYHFRLFPFSLGEIIHAKMHSPDSLPEAINNLHGHSSHATVEAGEQLFTYSGFPEPFLSANNRILNLWQKNRTEKLIREDLRDLTRLPELGQLETFCAILPDRVGSPISHSSLARDFEVSPPTIKNWINHLEKIYYLYQVKPYSHTLARSIKKEGKIYLWDYSVVEDKGLRYENYIANHLYKAVSYWSDLGYGSFSLGLLRDKELHEVDFVIIKNNKPWVLIEAKSGDVNYSAHLDYFMGKLKTVELCILLTNKPNEYRRIDNRRFIISAQNFLPLLP